MPNSTPPPPKQRRHLANSIDAHFVEVKEVQSACRGLCISKVQAVRLKEMVALCAVLPPRDVEKPRKKKTPACDIYEDPNEFEFCLTVEEEADVDAGLARLHASTTERAKIWEQAVTAQS
eukprot:Platyproteum_vivax@DN5720_c0_g1_i3.p1